MLADFDEKYSDRRAIVGGSVADDVYEFKGGKNTSDDLLSESCCNISTCGGGADKGFRKL